MKAYLFPGQGSQFRGMGGDLFSEFEELTQKADQILGYSIAELCLEDPRQELNRTQFTQPAIYVKNALSYYKTLCEEGAPDFVAGHSLGEFNALLAAECFDFETGLKLVQRRGQLMSQATEGSMAAVLNVPSKEVERMLAEAGLDEIDLANFNTLSQIVLSGPTEAIIKAETLFQQGDMLFSPLNASGAFHSRYMSDASRNFADFLRSFQFSPPKMQVIANVTARPYCADEVAQNLSTQIAGSVRWFESMKYLLDLSLEQKEEIEFKEVGQSDILSKMIDKIKDEVGYTAPTKRQTSPLKVVLNNTDSERTAAAPVTNSSDDAQEIVTQWNQRHPVGTRVKSKVFAYGELETRSEAMILFGHRAAVYMKDYDGYFDIMELEAC